MPRHIRSRHSILMSIFPNVYIYVCVCVLYYPVTKRVIGLLSSLLARMWREPCSYKTLSRRSLWILLGSFIWQFSIYSCQWYVCWFVNYARLLTRGKLAFKAFNVYNCTIFLPEHFGTEAYPYNLTVCLTLAIWCVSCWLVYFFTATKLSSFMQQRVLLYNNEIL